MFLPTTKKELEILGWKKLEIILITGDAYIDSPFSGVSVIGKVLLNAGYKVGIIGQPDINSEKDIMRLGEPDLFWGVTGGCVDSMIANYTALKKFRKSDDFTPGGKNTKRPDRAVIVYSNLIRKYFKNTVPIVLGGIEASLRRIAHYDYWQDTIRRSILFDAKADYLIYGMGEKTVVELAEVLKNCKKEKIKEIKGLCYISKEKPDSFFNLPSYEEVKSDKIKFIKMFNEFYKLNITGKTGFVQKHNDRYLVQNPRQDFLKQEELDKIYELDYERDAHPYYKQQGIIKAIDTIKFSITSHRGCFGECNFCAIAVHQGKHIENRSEKSIIKEAQYLTKLSDFKGYITDISGPTANMYGMDCKNNFLCANRCFTDEYKCKNLNFSHEKLINLLRNLRKIIGIKKIFIGSGLRYDIVLEDKKFGDIYLKDLTEHHISGQLKIAPEHINERILKLMGKTKKEYFLKFIDKFYKLNKNKKQFLTFYIIAAHPGCYKEDMIELKKFFIKKLKILPEQVQIFTPAPSTYSALMYYTGIDPFTGDKIFVEKNLKEKEKQKRIIIDYKNGSENCNRKVLFKIKKQVNKRNALSK